MRKLFALAAIAIVTVVATAQGRGRPQPSDFDIKCGQFNYCTFTSKTNTSGTWWFSDFQTCIANPASSCSRAMSTHDPATLSTPYTTVITFTVGATVDTGYVRCSLPWDPKGMCREIHNP